MSRKIKASESQFSYKFRNLFIKYPELTKTYLADLCGVTRQTVDFWCNGKSVPDANSLKIICKTFQISADYLLGINNMNGNTFIDSAIRSTGLSEDAAWRIVYNAKFAEYINILADSDKFIELLK